MKRFEKVKSILDELVQGEPIGAHGAFWRGIPIEEFREKAVWGYRLVFPGDSGASNLVKALKAEAPFGADSGTSRAIYRRMPAGRPPATDSQIDYIVKWIDDGCPDDDDLEVAMAVLGEGEDEGEEQTAAHHNAYWREFDNWAMFNAPLGVQNAIGVFFPTVPDWIAFARDKLKEDQWQSTIASTAVQEALILLSGRQRETVHNYYGNPIDLAGLFDSYKRFGAGTLPPDPLRPQDPHHRMDGVEMWFFWSAFADGCLRSGIDLDFWLLQARAVLVGLIHDGLFRGRMSVIGFAASESGSEEVLRHMRGIPNEQLGAELATRFVDSGLVPEA